MDNLKNEAREVKGRAIGYISAAFGLVAGLAWNEAVISLINVLFPVDKNSVFIKFVYAGVLTVVLVIVVKRLDSFLKKENQ